MITKMKKITLFMSETDIDNDLNILGQLGVMHIKPFHQAEDESINRVSARIEQMHKAISILEKYNKNPSEEHESDAELKFSDKPRTEIALMEQVLQTEETKSQKIELAQKLQNTKQWYNDWGNISIREIKKLKENGVYLKLYLINDDALEKLSTRNDIVVIGKLNNKNQVLLITENSNEKLENDEIEIPTYRLSTLEDSIKQTNQEIETADKQLQILYAQISLLKNALKERVRRYKVRNVQYSGIDIENQFRYWKGYVPEQAIPNFISTAEEQNWGYLIENPTDEELEEVPTLIRSPKWVESIKPVMNFMGLVPGYNEIDVSRVFMIFLHFLQEFL
jgi:V/A-type H+/Na+-transporting ATPase subunit I